MALINLSQKSQTLYMFEAKRPPCLIDKHGLPTALDSRGRDSDDWGSIVVEKTTEESAQSGKLSTELFRLPRH